MFLSTPVEVLPLPDPRTRGKWQPSTIPLPERVKDARQARLERDGHNLFRKGYNPETHQLFARVLRTWIDGGSRPELAEYYRSFLQGFPKQTGPCFLKQFFAKEPQLKAEFEQWIAVALKS